MKALSEPKPASRSASFALGLVVTGWLLIAWGAFRQLGDPSPMTPRVELEASRVVSLTCMFSGVIALAASVWLSGLSFRDARVRATLALLLFAVPLLSLFVCAFLAGA